MSHLHSLSLLGLLVTSTACSTPQPALPEPYSMLRALELGRAPHQITFSADGTVAYVAIAGDDRIACVATDTFIECYSIPVEHTPIGVAVWPGQQTGLIATQFQSQFACAIDAGHATRQLEVGEGPTFLVPLPANRLLFSVERGDQLQVVRADTWSIEATYPTGSRPFPPAPTADGRKAFVPNYDDGTVTVIDLWNGETRATTLVGKHPSGGTVLPGDLDYAVAVRGEDKIKFLNVGSHQVDDELSVGIGDSPFSVVTTHDGRLAFVNNTDSHDVSVIDLATRTVIRRFPTGEIPIAMAVDPEDTTLWVACEGSHVVQVFALPPRPPVVPSPTKTTQIAVLGMIHSGHRSSARWGLDQVRQTIENFAPDVLCVEIPPNRWKRVAKDFAERSVIEDSRAKVFPEYVDVVMPMTKTHSFEIEPCAAWTVEMNNLRRARMREFQTAGRFSTAHAEYQAATAAARSATEAITETDDPQRIHTDAYDAATKASLEPYDRYLNDHIGPGGWTNINQGHWDLIEAAIRRHPGERILVTFGAGHKYWILEQLRRMPGIEVVDVRDYLP